MIIIRNNEKLTSTTLCIILPTYRVQLLFNTNMANRQENKPLDVDEALEELGTGRFQIRIYILIGLILTFSNISPLSFTLTATDLDYRCYVPACDARNNSIYEPHWLKNAIPFDANSGKPKKCLRYRQINESIQTNCTETTLFSSEKETCDRWVFARNQNTIGKEPTSLYMKLADKSVPACWKSIEANSTTSIIALMRIVQATSLPAFELMFGIMCEDRKWLLTMVGTANTIGQYIGISFFGIISDSYGRKFIALFCTIVSALFGVSSAFSTNYVMFVILEFLNSLFSSGIYRAAFILGLEFMSPKMRSMVTTTMGIFYPFGAAVMGIVAWWVEDWRKLLIICYAPALLFIFYYSLIPESPRWLEINGRHKEAIKVIQNISNKNRISLSEKVQAKMDCSKKNNDVNQITTGTWTTLNMALKSKTLLFRTLACSYCWFTFTLTYYGLSVNSVELVGDSYLNFILINLIEVPAFIFSSVVMMKYPRKPVQIITLILTSITCMAYQLIHITESYIQISLFLLSKFFITLSLVIFYVYSAEMFPTEVRMSLFGVSSLIGRTGTILAPQTILLKQYIGQKAPVLLFGSASLIASLISMIFPETFEKKLSDTLADVNN